MNDVLTAKKTDASPRKEKRKNDDIDPGPHQRPTGGDMQAERELYSVLKGKRGSSKKKGKRNFATVRMKATVGCQSV